ncbi:MAG: flagellar protein FliS [Sphingorhabdus sp.]|nr:flagellar protein FliS [Sphingorhabdus sp.]
MLHAKFDEASAQYRSLALQAEIDRADPHRLVAMLYDELQLCIQVLTVRAQTGQRLTDDPQAHRARSIILSLRSGLDFNASALATSLDALYAALAVELDERLAHPEPERILELGSAVDTLAQAWRAIAAADQSA